MRPALLLLLLALPWPLPAAAQTIHHCVDARGNPVFTDRQCSDLQAVPYTPRAAPETAAPAAAPPLLCAADFSALRQAVVEAFATRDANRLAGLMLWEGHGRQGVVAGIRRLAALMERPLVEVGRASSEATDDDGPPDAAMPDAVPADTAQTPPELVLRTASSDGSGVPDETRFAVVRRSGCLWLRP
ncbi:DUF4124 domain-containing protein [Fulvimonas soli]|jgi:hypothetical protein|uniref:Uncharacterized protein DUF4124 n=1 Tax=Fulvimonas soli TaxID=155197 RepID=A0A316HVN5_9GAMM|nr:DUF4124 domain-containing protein [Fulvimonas soli]PWK82383.1 uncharacterized protein DUF4124 [Fulvimonas soli]